MEVMREEKGKVQQSLPACGGGEAGAGGGDGGGGDGGGGEAGAGACNISFDTLPYSSLQTQGHPALEQGLRCP